MANARSEDLLDCLSEASGKDVGDFVGKWITQIGYPVIFVSRTDNALSLRQERFLCTGERGVSFEPWPLEPTVSWGKGKWSFFFDQKSASVDLPLMATASPPYLLLNPHSSMMMQVIYSPGMWNDVVKHAMELEPVTRISLLESRLLLSSAGLISSSEFLQLALVFGREGDKSPCVELLGAEGVEFSAAFGTRWNGALVNATKHPKISSGSCCFALPTLSWTRFGLNKAPGEHQVISDLRSSVLGILVQQ